MSDTMTPFAAPRLFDLAGGVSRQPADEPLPRGAAPLANYLSEAGLIRARVHVEMRVDFPALNRPAGASDLLDAERSLARAPRDFGAEHIALASSRRHPPPRQGPPIGSTRRLAPRWAGHTPRVLRGVARHFLHLRGHQQPGVRADHLLRLRLSYGCPRSARLIVAGSLRPRAVRCWRTRTVTGCTARSARNGGTAQSPATTRASRPPEYLARPRDGHVAAIVVSVPGADYDTGL